MHHIFPLVLVTLSLLATPFVAEAFHKDIYQPRVPVRDLAAVRATANPVPFGAAARARGRAVYFGKGLCTTCHSKDGSGANFPGHRPRNFTNREWAERRTDGELMWVLKHGSPGTGMPQRVGTVITEEEGWDVIHFIRGFAR